MKRYLLTIVVACLTPFLISWGRTGHEAVALIAERHLKPQAKAAVKTILGEQSLVDVSVWADEIRVQDAYKYTTPRHYANVPLGLSYDEFRNNLINQGKNTVYYRIESMVHTLSETAVSTTEERKQALEFLVHFVGDAHQPMHISRKEDLGGNTVQVQFDNNGTNLHSLWDSKLIDHQGLTYQQMAKDYDTASSEQIKLWQHDDIVKWLYESYQISTKLYAEVDQNNKLDNAYYDSHIGIVKQRIEMAGIRLAGLLNACFSKSPVVNKTFTTTVVLTSPPLPQTPDSSAVEAELKDLPNLIGKQVAVKGKVYGLKDFGSMALVNLGAAYPNQLATVVLRGEAKKHFSADVINGKTVVVTGVVSAYKGKPQIIVNDNGQLSVLEK